MGRKCPRCGSENTVKVVPGASIAIPEIKQEIMEGKTITSCCCAGGNTGHQYKCRDCHFKWDDMIERAMKGSNEE